MNVSSYEAGRRPARRLAILLLAGAIVAVGMGPASARGTFTRHQHGTPGTPGARAYWTYVPAGLGRARVPLLVYLHGCSQTAEDAARQTGFNRLADRERFIVAYPDQNVTAPQSYPFADGNGIGCWNWFHPDHQERGAGEPASIAAITRAVRRAHRIDGRRVFIAGASAGADMAIISAATYPDVYASLGAVSGCPYRTCSDTSGVLTFRAMGSRARAMPMFTAQGSTDNLNPLPQVAGLIGSWLGVADLADDGLPNGSVSRVPAEVEHRAIDQTPDPGSGDACVRPSSWTCPGGVVGFDGAYPHTILRYRGAGDCDLVQAWLIHGMLHAYPKGDPDTGFSDPLGPDVTAAMWRFFEGNPRGSCA